MLVLSRRAGESVVIGHDVIITVLEVRGDVVRVGISAPRSVQVHREEVFKELQEANRGAVASDDAVAALTAALTGKPAAPEPAVPAPATAAPAAATAPLPDTD